MDYGLLRFEIILKKKWKIKSLFKTSKVFDMDEKQIKLGIREERIY